ncbi:GTP-binding protein Di-Ras2 [Trichonephila clavipes]|nr:GTP-binding protein Di-Ras2 [Trichonephila clavipes]
MAANVTKMVAKVVKLITKVAQFAANLVAKYDANLALSPRSRQVPVISCNKNICTLQITDTTGSHQFPAMQRLNISKGHAFILVYAVTSSQSLEELRPIFEVIKEVKGGDMEGIPIMLVGNKCDETEARELQTSVGQEQAKKWNCGFMETSAKTNLNVKELFQELLNMEKRRNVSLNMDTSKKRSQLRKEKLKGKCSVM